MEGNPHTAKEKAGPPGLETWMENHQISLTIKSASGATWPDAEFNVRNRVRQLLDRAVHHFHLDQSLTYEVLLGSSRSLPLDDSLEGAGVRDDDTLLIRSIGRPIDGQRVHRSIVERLVAQEVAELERLVADGSIVRVEQRNTSIIAELRRKTYESTGLGGFAVPILGAQRQSNIVLVLRCDNYDTVPPSVSFAADWASLEELSYSEWPKGPGIVERHYATGKPFVCRPGTREYHSHVQHGDQPWDRFRGLIRPRDLVRDLASDVLNKNVLA